MSISLIRSLYRHKILIRQLPTTQRFLVNYSSDNNKQDKSTGFKEIVRTDSTERHHKYSRENVRQYFFTRFFDYIQNYDKVFEKNFPKAMHVYRVFMIGMKDFYGDMKKFFKINSIVSKKGIKGLTRKEMELMHQIPKDIMKVAPVLLIAALPFANYVIFPIAYMYPRTFLTSHFWSIQQRVEFQELYLKDRTAYNKKIFRKLQENLESTKLSPHHKDFNYVLGLLGSGTHPSSSEIIAIKNIFLHRPYKIDSLPSSHLTYLCKLHGIHTFYLKRVRLSEHCYMMHNMDLAIKNEGGVHNLPIDALRTACYLRGLNHVSLPNEEMVEWLQEWIRVSMNIGTEYISLYLHLPILLTYNHPNNWRLTHK